MWEMMSKRRHKFIHTQLPEFEADDINYWIEKEFKKMEQCEPTPTSVSLKAIKSKIVEDNRKNLAYGLWGLPKVTKDICNGNPWVQRSSLNTLSELLYNDLERQRAIRDWNIVRKLKNLMQRRLMQKTKDQCIIPIILRCFAVIAISAEGALLMGHETHLMHTLYCMSERGLYSKTSSRILRTLTVHLEVLNYFIDKTKWYFVVCEMFKRNDEVFLQPDLVDHFSQFLKVSPGLAIERGIFDLLLEKIPERKPYQQGVLKCFAFLLNCKQGQDLLDQRDGVRVLYEIIIDEKLSTYEFVAQALQNATAGSTVTLWRCKEFTMLPQILVRRAYDKKNSRQQQYCLKTLINISMIPSVKAYIQKVCMPQVRRVECRTPEVKAEKIHLIRWLKTKASSP